MKKKQKKSQKNKKFKKKKSKPRYTKKRKKILKKRNKKIKKKKILNIKKRITVSKFRKPQNESLTLKLVKLQLSLKPEFNFKINFGLEKYIQGFFDKISETISSYKILKKDEKKKIKIRKN